jgi:hypothetical protein
MAVSALPDRAELVARALRFDVHRLPVDANLEDSNRSRYGAVHQFTGAHIELREMQRALD